MSKRIQLTTAALFVAIFPISTLIARHIRTHEPQRPSVTTSAAKNSAVVAATVEILKEASEIRELPILRPVKSGAESREAIERMLIKNLNERTTPAEMHAAELAMRKFGLAPKDFEYRPFVIKLLAEQVAGYYDPKAQEFHLADWLELETQKPVMAHELVHALQDQHFNLRRFERWPQGDSDAQLAAHALIEGDATLAMNLYLAKNPLVALSFGRSLLTGVSTEVFDQAPRSMKESLIFPYLQGSLWATQVYKRGGWKLVSEAYTRLPLSSEQILHPEKYFNYERPVKVVLPDVTKLLNAGGTAERNTGSAGVSPSSASNNAQRKTGSAGVSPASDGGTAERNTGSAGVSPALGFGFAQGRSTKRPLPTADRPQPTASWRRLESDVNGEWSYYLILDQFLNSPADSKRAAAGWAGDRYAVYEGPGGQILIAHVSVWDTENDARDFFDAYVKRTELRYPAGKRLDGTSSKLETRNPELQEVSWQTAEGAVIIQLRGSRVVVLEGIPAGVNSDGLVKAFSL